MVGLVILSSSSIYIFVHIHILIHTICFFFFSFLATIVAWKCLYLRNRNWKRRRMLSDCARVTQQQINILRLFFFLHFIFHLESIEWMTQIEYDGFNTHSHTHTRTWKKNEKKNDFRQMMFDNFSIEWCCSWWLIRWTLAIIEWKIICRTIFGLRKGPKIEQWMIVLTAFKKRKIVLHVT